MAGCNHMARGLQPYGAEAATACIQAATYCHYPYPYYPYSYGYPYP